ncbi:MAG: hypothetical protein WC635_14705 [Bacteriovorax sp.]|jgi:TRAP-type C4-dicarboxylate transport system substrate-binding protein
MKNFFFRSICLVTLFSVAAVAAETNQKAVTKKDKVIKLRWEVVHSPYDYFVRMAKVFKEKVEKETNKRVVVEISAKKTHSFNKLKEQQTSNDAYTENKAVALQRAEGVKALQEGKVDIAQGYSYYLASVSNPEYHALELPYVFENYDHVNRFLESETGENLLASTSSTHNMRGLAYSFSGGLLVALTPKDKPLITRESWNGRHFRTIDSLIRLRAVKELGGEIADLEEQNDKINDGESKRHRATVMINSKIIDAEEINLPDLERKLFERKDVVKFNGVIKSSVLNKISVSETQHTLLSTIFLINEKKFQSMSAEDQKIVKDAAVFAARFERNLTVHRYELAKKHLIKLGFAWNTVPTTERNKIRSATEAVYTQLYKDVPSTKMIVSKINEMKTVTPKKIAGQ